MRMQILLAQHIDQLWQLVKAPPAQDAAETGDTWIARELKPRSGWQPINLFKRRT
jgi:hypothetical protein